MNDFCKKCGCCCRLIPADAEKKLLFRNGIQDLPEDFSKMLSPAPFVPDSEYVKNISASYPNVKFYTCKYLSANNLCMNPSKPENCEQFPSLPFSLLPENCGYEGVIFLKNEKLKQKIRKIKEEIVHYEALIISDEKNKENYEKIIKSKKGIVAKYTQYGSLDW